MAELLHLIVDLLGRVTPVRTVMHWEAGLLYLCGRYVRRLGPGLKVVVPGLMQLHTVSMVPRNESTPRQTVTLRDGRSLTFTASLTMVVDDPAAAWNSVERWSETVVEEAAGVLSELLAEADPVRFDPSYGKRERLRDEIRDEVDAVTSRFGVRVTAVRFNDFVINARPVRLLLDRPAAHHQTAAG